MGTRPAVQRVERLREAAAGGRRRPVRGEGDADEVAGQPGQRDRPGGPRAAGSEPARPAPGRAGGLGMAPISVGPRPVLARAWLLPFGRSRRTRPCGGYAALAQYAANSGEHWHRRVVLQAPSAIARELLDSRSDHRAARGQGVAGGVRLDPGAGMANPTVRSRGRVVPGWVGARAAAR
jgi:hypothetical protein